MLSKSFAIRMASLTISLMTLAACGNASLKNKDKKKGASDQEQLAAQSNDDGCLKLGGPVPINPYQNSPAYDQGPNDNVVVVNPPNKGEEPPPPPPGKGGYNPPPSQGQPCTPPGQQPPCQTNCGKDDGYRPIDIDDDIVVQPFPTQRPIDSGCGVKGKYCDDGGPGQWPTQTVNGGIYDRNRAQGCMDAFRNAGYDTRGQWNIDAREVRNVNVLSQDAITDFGTAHTLVMIKNVGVLGTTHFELLNPNALYCIENVSVLGKTRVSSCHSGNVVWGSDVNVLSNVQTLPVDCR